MRKAICRLACAGFFPGLRVSESRHRLSGCLRLRSPLPPLEPTGCALVSYTGCVVSTLSMYKLSPRRTTSGEEEEKGLPRLLGCCLCPMQYRAGPELAAMCNSSVQKLGGNSLLFPLDSGLRAWFWCWCWCWCWMLYFYMAVMSLIHFNPCTPYIHWCNAGKKEKKGGEGPEDVSATE